MLYRKISPGIEVFKWLKSCINLQGLSLKNVLVDVNMFEIIDHLNNLEYLRLLYCNYFDSKYTQIIIKKPKLKLKKLCLSNFSISDAGYDLISQNCPFLELLYLRECKLRDESVSRMLQNTKNLKYFKLIQNLNDDLITNDFINDIPQKILVNLKVLNLYLPVNRLNKFVSVTL